MSDMRHVHSNMRIIDTHSHIHFEDYDTDREAVIFRAREAGVTMIAVGTDIEESRRAVAVAEKYPESVLGATVGLHPTSADAPSFSNSREFANEYFEELKQLAQHPRVVAIGECGLDYYHITDPEARKRQKEIFEAQVELASELKKPLVIHCRDAHPDLLSILKANSYKLKATNAGVMHFFGGAGSWENVPDYLAMGFYISLAGVITFKNYAHAEDIKRLPLDRIVVETDAPYVAPVPYRGERNEPGYIVETVKRLAVLYGKNVEQMSEMLLENTQKLFRIPAVNLALRAQEEL